MCSVWPSVSQHRHSGKQRRTNELTVTHNHLCTSTLFVPPAYLIKIRAKVMFNKSPVVHPHSHQAGANKRSALMAHASLLLNWQFCSFLLPSPNSDCMWCDIKKESVTDLCHYGCSRLSIQSCFCPSMCLTAKGRTQLFSCCNGFLGSVKCANPYVGCSYFECQSAVQVAGDGGDHVALGDSVVTGVGEALTTTAGAVLALTDLRSAGPHCHCTATLWGFRDIDVSKINRWPCHISLH